VFAGLEINSFGYRFLFLLHIVFVGSIRYREPAVLAFMPLAAGVLARASPQLVQNGAEEKVGQAA